MLAISRSLALKRHLLKKKSTFLTDQPATKLEFLYGLPMLECPRSGEPKGWEGGKSKEMGRVWHAPSLVHL